MYRFLVPRLGFALVMGLATLLIGVIVLRSPDTHGNLWNRIKPGYSRTAVATTEGEFSWEIPGARIALFHPEAVLPGPASPADHGRQVYVKAGCAQCHGLEARGGVVGPSLEGAPSGILKNVTRNGRRGMPAFSQASLSDADLDGLVAYLHQLQASRPDKDELAALGQLSYDPSLPPQVLLKGKSVLRRSCAACHSPPTREEILAFGSDAELSTEVAMMVRNTNLSLEEARALAYYLLAVRHGADPVRLPGTLAPTPGPAATASPTPEPTTTITPAPAPTATPAAIPPAQITYDPTWLEWYLTKGKEVYQGRCSTCHRLPSEQRLGAFPSDEAMVQLVIGMAQLARASEEDTAAMVSYLLALRHGSAP